MANVKNISIVENKIKIGINENSCALLDSPTCELKWTSHARRVTILDRTCHEIKLIITQIGVAAISQ